MTKSRTPRAAFITGASSGIGCELARVFAAHRADVVLVARSEAKLEALADELEAEHRVRAVVLPADLADPEAPSRLVSELERLDLSIDALVNNAGFGSYGPSADADLASDIDMLHVNVVAPTRLTKLLLPAMLARGYGWVMNVSSMAAFEPGPLIATYCATKVYVLHFTEALANELEGTGVTVTALCPGLTDTGFWDRSGVGETRFAAARFMTASAVAESGYRGLMAGKPVVIPGLVNRVLAQGYRLAPRKLGTRIARYLHEQRTRH